MKKVHIFFAFLFSLNAFSQSSQLQWIKAITSPGEVLYPEYEVPLPNEGVAITGWQQRDWQPWSAVFVIALDSSGNEMWRDSIVAIGTGYELYLRAITATPNGDVIVTGEFNGILKCNSSLVSDTDHYCYSTYIAKFNNGTLSSFNTVYNTGVAQLTSDNDGNLLFTMNMCGSGHGFGASWNAQGTHDLLVCKVSPSDSLLWLKQFSGQVYSQLIAVNPNNEVVLFGAFSDTLFFDTCHYSLQNGCLYGSDIFMIYIDASGSITNSRISYCNALYPSQVIFDNDKIIMTSGVCGNHECGVGFEKIDSTVTPVWYKAFPNVPLGYADYHDTYHIASIDHNSYLACGPVRAGMMGDTAFAIHDFVFTHFDFSGNILSTDSFATPTGDYPFYYGDWEATSGHTSLYFTGMFRDSMTVYNQIVSDSGLQMFVCRMIQGAVVGITEPSAEDHFIIHPNPTNGLFIVQTAKQMELKIYNSFGEVIHQQIITSANQQIDLTGKEKGIYYLVVTDREKIYSDKIILQ